MKTITEAEAQQLANLLGMWIAVDDNEDVYWYDEMPDNALYPSGWYTIGGRSSGLPIRIASDRPWTEQIFGPE